ncbi:hypothetical protein DAPPUDRAFT_195155 [Daphnia pulex]|uniref:EF-hand domain-containing protein n=1 Tax=Daphnia pulex TaxID=6669 RepID=E9GB22_DAPPU|nr:hypothetical protein DAPPUDRAFT_195155 [Daphnia pulex]|eukprot:EFX83446.1 hypothetical protein DAPPUDRAFT_195155 [Daphnia pulex]
MILCTHTLNHILFWRFSSFLPAYRVTGGYTHTNCYTLSLPKEISCVFYLFGLSSFWVWCVRKIGWDRQEAPNKRTETVRRRVTDLTASTPFAKPPVCKNKIKPTGTSNHAKLNFFFFSLFPSNAFGLPTGFSRKELQLMYRSFKQECPSGTVNEATFKRIYTHFFPYGDVSPYAHCVFRAFDIRHNGVINFEDLVLGVSALSRGSVPDKLRWVFTLYDADGDGVISRSELRDVVMAIHRLSPHGKINDKDSIQRHADRIFQKLDLNCDGQVTWDEFLETCTKDETIANTMANMDVTL